MKKKFQTLICLSHGSSFKFTKCDLVIKGHSITVIVKPTSNKDHIYNWLNVRNDFRLTICGNNPRFLCFNKGSLKSTMYKAGKYFYETTAYELKFIDSYLLPLDFSKYILQKSLTWYSNKGQTQTFTF